jgi:hypothetical protein
VQEVNARKEQGGLTHPSFGVGKEMRSSMAAIEEGAKEVRKIKR